MFFPSLFFLRRAMSEPRRPAPPENAESERVPFSVPTPADAEKPLPEFGSGDYVHYIAQSNFVVQYEILEKHAYEFSEYEEDEEYEDEEEDGEGEMEEETMAEGEQQA